MESIQRIVIRTEVFGQNVPSNRLLEHPAEGHSIHDAALDAESDDATGELVHHDENPVGSHHCRFASEQVATPQTVLGVTDESEPGWTGRIRFGPVVSGQDTAHHILVDL